MTCPAPVYVCTLSGGRFVPGGNARTITVSPDGTRLLVGGPPVSGNGEIDEFDITTGAYIADFTEGWSPRFAPDGEVYWAILAPSIGLDFAYHAQIRKGSDDTSDVFIWEEPDGAGLGDQSIHFRLSPVDGLIYTVDIGGAFATDRIYQVDPATSGASLVASGFLGGGTSELISQSAPDISNGDGAVWFLRLGAGYLCRWDGAETQVTPSYSPQAPGCVDGTIIAKRTVAGVPTAYAVDSSFATTLEPGWDEPSGLSTSYGDYAYTADGTLYLLGANEIYVVREPSGWLIGAFN